jgi:iron-sulfur cluster assembly accessory protein
MIFFTNTAKLKLTNIIKQNGKSALLYVTNGGCNGFSYKFKILDKNERPNDLDDQYNLDDKYNIYLCNKSIMWIIGTHIDYIDDIMGSRFDFLNPNIDSKCGCGTSFNFK